jgi:mRNA-degrading endonuclease RelE of RelBE toxin-antitoxin system
MTVLRTKTFKQQYRKLPESIQKKVDRQLGYLVADLRHPSLVAKRVKGTDDIWEGRVDIHHRFTFQLHDELIVLRKVGPHDMLRQP